MGGMCVALSFPEVHNDLPGLLCVKGQDLVPVGRLIVPSDQAYHRGVVCKLDFGVRTMHHEEGVQKAAQRKAFVALWCSG